MTLKHNYQIVNTFRKCNLLRTLGSLPSLVSPLSNIRILGYNLQCIIKFKKCGNVFPIHFKKHPR